MRVTVGVIGWVVRARVVRGRRQEAWGEEQVLAGQLLAGQHRVVDR